MVIWKGSLKRWMRKQVFTYIHSNSHLREIFPYQNGWFFGNFACCFFRVFQHWVQYIFDVASLVPCIVSYIAQVPWYSILYRGGGGAPVVVGVGVEAILTNVPSDVEPVATTFRLVENKHGADAEDYVGRCWSHGWCHKLLLWLIILIFLNHLKICNSQLNMMVGRDLNVPIKKGSRSWSMC